MIEFEMTRKIKDNITIGSMETTGYEIEIQFIHKHGQSARLGLVCNGRRVEILRSELKREANEGN
jgi:sRNA-binding carbon storage regulator CsrA